MSRARAALQSLRLRAPEEGSPESPHDTALQWMLSKWAGQQRRTELPVSGSSMWPVLRSGERIRVRHGGAPPRRGEIVVFLQGERTVAHRVIRRRGEAAGIAVRVKGDVTLVADPGWLEADRVVGIVEAVVVAGVPRRRFGLGGVVGAGIAFLSGLQGTLSEPLHRFRLRRARAGGGA